MKVDNLLSSTITNFISFALQLFIRTSVFWCTVFNKMFKQGN